jgi:hypothetical protein
MGNGEWGIGNGVMRLSFFVVCVAHGSLAPFSIIVGCVLLSALEKLTKARWCTVHTLHPKALLRAIATNLF